MISKRTIVLGVVLLLAGGVLASEIWSARSNCGGGARGLTVNQALTLAQQHGHSGPCGQSAASRSAQPIEVGLVFLSGLALMGSVAADVSAWRNAGWDD